MQSNQKSSKTKESQVHGTVAGEMPNPDAPKLGETEDQIRDAFTGRPILLPEPKGDLADRALADQESELDEQIARARMRVKKP
jgi:hypothetical protein